jgi:GR25 family glycosyltransferase involved in LPS biosynthesis
MKEITSIPAYVITVSQHPMKYQKCVDSLARIGILPKKYQSIDINSISQGQINDMTYPSVQYSIENGQSNDSEFDTSRQIGSYLSHAEIWKSLLDSQDESIIVMEDGIMPVDTSQNINRFLAEVEFIDPDWEFVFLGFSKPYGNYRRDTRVGHMTQKVTDMTYGTYAYLINKKGAKKLLDKAFPIVDKLDGYISLMTSQRGLASYRPSRTFFSEDNEEEDEAKDIYGKMGIKSKLNRLSNRTITIIIVLTVILIIFLMMMIFRGGKGKGMLIEY